MPATTTTSETLSLVSTSVSVAPMVLLSVVDHYNRAVAPGSRKRAVGALLGQNDGTTVRVSNSFAVPFEEDERNPDVWFLDHNFIESMNDMFKKINAREKLIGWYHSGPKLRASDLQINDLFKRYTPNPLLVIVDVQPTASGVPTDAYFAIDEIKDDGTTSRKTFVHTPSTIEAEEAEEIGVEHLLRDIRDVAVGTLSTRLTNQLQSLQGLHYRLRDISAYLKKVVDGELPVNHTILGSLQDVFNLLPNLASPKTGDDTKNAGASELQHAMSVKSNDQLMAIYLSSLVRAITAFHDLIENKIQNRQQAEEKEAAKLEAEREKQEAASKDRDGEKKSEGPQMSLDGKDAPPDTNKDGDKKKK